MTPRQLIRPDILAMPAAVAPFSPPDEVAARQGLPLQRIVKLDGNENLYGPSPQTLAALRSEASWHLYPDAMHESLRHALASYSGVGPENIVVTSGGDELILLVAQLLLEPGDQVINTPPTFSVYEDAVRMQHGEIIVVPRRREDGYDLDTAAILSAVGGKTKGIFVCNPNNPTGGLTPPDDILRLLDTGVMVMLDEAYTEFSGVTMAPLIRQRENLIILRTMSKWAALAGLRVGYGIMAASVADQMRKIKMAFNVNLAGYIAALASLSDRAYLLANVARMVAERERLFARLQKIPFLRPYPSHGNYILCDVLGADARRLRDELEREGVLVRLFQNRHLPNAIRITVGKAEHSEAVIAALGTVGQRLRFQ